VPSRSSCSRAKSLLGDQPGNSRPHANRACRHQHHTQGFATSSSATHLAAILSPQQRRGMGPCAGRLHGMCAPQQPETAGFFLGLSKALLRDECAPQRRPRLSPSPRNLGLASFGKTGEKQDRLRRLKTVKHLAARLSSQQQPHPVRPRRTTLRWS